MAKLEKESLPRSKYFRTISEREVQELEQTLQRRREDTKTPVADYERVYEVLDKLIKERLKDSNGYTRIFFPDSKVWKKGFRLVENTKILHSFADLGIYDYTDCLYLDSREEGDEEVTTLYLKYSKGSQKEVLQIDLSFLPPFDVIHEIFRLTVFSGKERRF